MDNEVRTALIDGGGETIFEVRTNQLDTLRKVVTELEAEITILRESNETTEVLIRQSVNEVRIAIIGNVDSGKSSLMGVLTKGVLDNGRGLARRSIFTLKHEIESGRTSSVSHEYLGFGPHGEIINKPRLSEAEITERSAKMINFIDLAGHEKYIKTTAFGLNGHAPDFVALIVGANMGPIGMAKEHLGMALALSVPIFAVITKIDISPPNITKETLEELKRVLKSPGSRKIPIIVRNEDDVMISVRNISNERICPIFSVSNVTGEGLPLLLKFLNLIPLRTNWNKLESSPVRLDIDSLYSVPGVGTVVSGVLLSGTLPVGTKVRLGPDPCGNFIVVSCRSIYTKSLPVKAARAGQSVTINIPKVRKEDLRPGMVLLDLSIDPGPSTCWEFEADILVFVHHTTIRVGYEPIIHCGASRQISKIIKLDKEVVRSKDRAQARIRFKLRPEYLTVGTKFIFREGRTKGIGRITSLE